MPVEEVRKRRRRSRPPFTIVAVLALATVVMRRRGYRTGGNVVVRCREGHLFTTTWIPGASLQSARLGWRRFQHCPVGQHWSLVAPVKESALTKEELRSARDNKDVRLP